MLFTVMVQWEKVSVSRPQWQKWILLILCLLFLLLFIIFALVQIFPSGCSLRFAVNYMCCLVPSHMVYFTLLCIGEFRYKTSQSSLQSSGHNGILNWNLEVKPFSLPIIDFPCVGAIISVPSPTETTSVNLPCW